MHVFQPVKNGEFVTTVASTGTIVLTAPWGTAFGTGTTGTTHEYIRNLEL
ncbi:hypothetical protein N9L50_04865 [Flavobacteriaceae bacterium]|jgi:hypothetical protein|nr:hypothetical protein [Flavobacteriaceae bacterium]MDA9851432.1 hypothetical protein [Flavobacteriaceae bacterium]